MPVTILILYVLMIAHEQKRLLARVLVHTDSYLYKYEPLTHLF